VPGAVAPSCGNEAAGSLPYSASCRHGCTRRRHCSSFGSAARHRDQHPRSVQMRLRAQEVRGPMWCVAVGGQSPYEGLRSCARCRLAARLASAL
jgi:hypothetical protein